MELCDEGNPPPPQQQPMTTSKPTRLWSSEVDLPGLGYVANNNLSLWIRFFWLAVFTVAVVTCFYQSAVIIANLIDDPSLSNMRYVYNKSIAFPAITICPYAKDNSDPVLNPSLVQDRFGNISDDEILNKLNAGTLTLFELWNLYKLNITGVSVTTSDHPEEHASRNTSNQAFVKISEVYSSVGTCVQIYLKKDLQLYERSIFFKLELTGDINLARVVIHQLETMHFEKYFYHRSGTIVASSRYRFEKHYLRITERSGWSNAWSNAYTPTLSVCQERNRNTKKRPCGTATDVSNCLAQCFVNNFVSREVKTLCRLPFMHFPDDIPLCNSIDNTKEMIYAIHNASEQFSPNHCGCPKMCFETHHIMDYRNKRASNDKPFAWRLDIYIPEVRIAVMEELAAYNIYQAMSDIGGVVGLSLGVCLLSVIEFFTSCFTNLILQKEEKPYRKKQQKIESCPGFQFPGLNRAFKEGSPLWLRTLWLIIFMSALLYCVYQCAQQTVYYLSDPSTMNVFNAVNETISFPTITVCPKRLSVLVLHELLINITPSLANASSSKPKRNVDIDHLITTRNLTINDIWNTSRLNIATEAIDAAKKTWNMHIISTIVGNCYSFSPKYMVNYTGIHTSQHLDLRIDDPQTNLIVIHSKEEEPLVKYLIQARAIDSMANSWKTRITLRISQLSYRNTMRFPCQEHYKVSQCLARCIEKAVTAKVLRRYCRLPYMEDLNSEIPVCTTEKEIRMMLNATLKVVDQFQRDTCVCPTVCKQVVYTTEYADDATTNYMNLITITLQTRDNNIMTIEEASAYSIFALFADIGGTFGLFIGFCILNTLEIIETVYSILKDVIKKLCFKKHLDTNTSIQCVTATVIQDSNLAEPTEVSSFNVSIPGITQLMNNNSPLWVRAVWFVIFAGACILCTIQCKERIEYYLSEPTEVSMYYAHNKTITMPLILICPMVDESIYSLGYKDAHFLSHWNTSKLQFEVYFNSTMHICENKTDGNLILTKMVTAAGICCMIKIKHPINYKGYHTSLTVRVIPSSMSSVWVAYFPRDYEAFAKYMSSIDSFMSLENRDKIAKVSLQITEIFQHDTRRDPCENGKKSAECVVDCTERNIYSKLKTKCRLPFMKESKIYPICSTMAEYMEIKNVSQDVLQSVDRKNCNCPRSCKETIYSFEEASMVGGPISWISVDTYFHENRISVIRKKSAYGFLNLLSDLGGSLGLVFGIGLLQLLELFACSISYLSVLSPRRERSESC